VKDVKKGGEKILLFGGLPYSYLNSWEITSELKLIEMKINVKFEEVSMKKLEAKIRELNGAEQMKASDLAEQLLSEALNDPQAKTPEKEEIMKATRLYVAMKSIIEEHSAEALTIACGPWIKNGPVPCVALTMFREEGIPAACQGDIDALITMILFKRASRWTSFMGGGIKIENYLGVSHCVLSRRMLGPTEPKLPYYISDYHGRKSSPTIHTIMPEGLIVTVARVTRNLESLILTAGKVVGNLDLKDKCRNTLLIEVKNVDKVLKAVKGVQQHFVVACGYLEKSMIALAEKAGMRIKIV